MSNKSQARKNRFKYKDIRIERGDAIHAEVQAYMERIALQHLKATGRGITDAVSVGDTSPFKAPKEEVDDMIKQMP